MTREGVLAGYLSRWWWWWWQTATRSPPPAAHCPRQAVGYRPEKVQYSTVQYSTELLQYSTVQCISSPVAGWPRRCTTHTPAAGTGPGSAPCPGSRSSCSICSIVLLLLFYCTVIVLLLLYYCIVIVLLLMYCHCNFTAILLYCYCILFSMKKNFISTEIVFIVNVTLLYK